jgi:glycogen debranching enzyme
MYQDPVPVDALWLYVQKSQNALAQALTREDVVGMMQFQENRAHSNIDSGYIMPTTISHYLTFIIDEAELNADTAYQDMVVDARTATTEFCAYHLFVSARYAILAAAMLEGGIKPAPVHECFGPKIEKGNNHE